MHNQNANARYTFDHYELDRRTFELFKDGQLVRIQRQPAQVLTMLIDRAGELVSKDELREQLWGGERFVDFDRSLAYCLHQIRAALSDDPRAPKYVETLRGLGYRFIGSLASPTDTDGPAVTGRPAPAPGRSPDRRVALALAALVLALTAGGLWFSGIWRGRSPAPATVTSAEDVLLQRADEYFRRFRRDDVVNALTMYREVLANAPDSARARAGAAGAMAWLAGHHQSATEAQRALSAAAEALRMAPDDPDVVAAHALGLHGIGRLSEAADAYRSALSLAPSRTDVYQRLALLEHQRGRLDEAVKWLDTGWRSADADPTPAGLLGVVLTELGFDTAARDWNRLAVSLAPDHPQSAYSEGLMAVRAGRLEEAETRLATAAAAQDPGALIAALYARVLAQRHGPSAALARLEAAAHLMPESHDVIGLLSAVYAAMGRDDDARRMRARVSDICRQGIASSPEAPMWPRCLAGHYAISGDLDAAVEWYERAAQVGWRKLKGDRRDGALALIAHDRRFQATQQRMADDIERMRRAVEARGVPRAVFVHTTAAR